MALALLRDLFCCCRADEQEEHVIYDERSHLIVPEITADDCRVVHKKFRERMTEIVRSKEGKMVNVSSKIPFNLHNQAIPKEQSHSSSRSGSFDPYYDRGFYACSDFHSNQDLERFRKQRSKYDHGLGRLRSISPSSYNSVVVGTSTRTRSPSPNVEQSSVARLLNIRLVGHDDNRVRGRTRERGSHPTALPGLRNPEQSEGDNDPTTLSAEQYSTAARIPGTQKAYALNLPDTSAMIVTWGD